MNDEIIITIKGGLSSASENPFNINAKWEQGQVNVDVKDFQVPEKIKDILIWLNKIEHQNGGMS